MACTNDEEGSDPMPCVLAVQVVANFGGSSFTCDVSSLETDALQCIQESMQQTQVPFPVRVRPNFNPMPTKWSQQKLHIVPQMDLCRWQAQVLMKCRPSRWLSLIANAASNLVPACLLLSKTQVLLVPLC